MLPPGLPPPPRQPADAKPNNPWNPFPDRLSFEFADYHFTTLQSSEFQVNQALDLWLAAVVNAGGDPCLVPWQTAKQMYGTIDAIKEGPTSWKTVQFHYTGPLLKGTPLKWMQETYKLCFQDPHSILLNQIALPELQDHFDYAPYMQFNAHDDHVWSNLMSGDWAWAEAVSAMLVSILIGSDKMTVSVATGHQEYHPVYIGAGNIHNSMDYPEQVWLAGVVQNWCASCDATPDNLDNPNAGLRDHETTQFLIRNFDPGVVWNNFGVCVDVVLIKGTFKDHLVTWVEEYLTHTHGERVALAYIQEIDQRDFSQWTGDDSKALMKVRADFPPSP
ncbi:C2H2-type domain-containing protein [Salix suchowensis]|nr:C2H2-type domain-containing protein [Salix suchowensis]